MCDVSIVREDRTSEDRAPEDREISAALVSWRDVEAAEKAERISYRDRAKRGRRRSYRRRFRPKRKPRPRHTISGGSR